MSNLTEQEIVDAIDQALERVERRFAKARAKSNDAVEAKESPQGRVKSKRKLVAAG